MLTIVEHTMWPSVGGDGLTRSEFILLPFGRSRELATSTNHRHTEQGTHTHTNTHGTGVRMLSPFPVEAGRPSAQDRPT